MPLAVLAEARGVRAFVRLRPPSETTDIELFDFSPARPGVITIKDPLSSGRCEHSYEFSGVFTQEQDQEKVFSSVAGPIVDAAVAGQSGCVLAYGQTGSGKTFSIFGEGSGQHRGILPRAAEHLFAMGRGSGLTVSFLEVYLDQVLDLGREASGAQDEPSIDGDGAEDGAGARASARRRRTRSAVQSAGSVTELGSGEAGPCLEIHETADGRVHARGLTRIPVRTLYDVRRIIDRGLARRATAGTAANVASSRSHTVFTVHLPPPGAGPDASTEDPASPHVSLSFVDLAGSERLAKTRAEGARFQEAVAINSSLTALGKVVLALAGDPHAGRHIPYRDSKLTRLLSPSLGGGACVALLATLHPRVEDYEESLNTLSFADRCKNLAHHPQVNYISAQKNSQMRIKDLQEQARQLQDAIRKQQQQRLDQAAAKTVKVEEGSLVASLGLPASRRGEDQAADAIDQAIAEAIRQGESAAARGAVRSARPGAAAGPAAVVGASPARGAGDTVGASAILTAAIRAATAPAAGAAPDGPSPGSRKTADAPAKGAEADALAGKLDVTIKPKATPGIVGLIHAASFATRARNLRSKVQIGGKDGAAAAAAARRDPGIQALLEVQEQRDREALAQEKAIQRMQAIEEERQQLQQLEIARSAEIKSLEKRRATLDAEKCSLQEELQHTLEAQEAEENQALLEVKEATERRLQHADTAFQNFSENIKLRCEAGAARQSEFGERQRELQEKHLEAVRELKSRQAEHLQELRSQWQSRLDAAQQRNEALAAELVRTRQRDQAVIAESQGEIVRLCSMAAKLAQIVSDAEDGLFPTIVRGELKEFVLPAGLRPPAPTAAEFPRLFDALAEAEDKVSKLERAVGRPISAGRTRLAVAAASGRYDGEAFLGTSRPSSASPRAPERQVSSAAGSASAGSLPAAVGNSGGSRVEEVRAGGRTPSAAVAANVPAAAAPPPAGPASRAASQDLASLTDVLCKEGQAEEAFSPELERACLRKEALEALDDEATLRYLQQLERRRDASRAALGEVTEKQLKMRSELEFKRGGLLPLGSHPCSRPCSAGRTLSRPTTPMTPTTRTGSRVSSRPTTATPTHSRPPTANGVPTTTALPGGRATR